MKQKIISYLSTIKNELSGISKYIYENPEVSFHEYKAYNYLIKILKKHNFYVTENYLNIPTAFSAQFGKGHPKICFTCEYDAVHDLGHIFGYNAASAISVGAALALSDVIPETGGSIIVIGSPGEITGSSKITMVNQGVFEDIDAVLTAQPHTINAASGASPAVMPLELIHNKEFINNYADCNSYSQLYSCSFLISALDLLLKNYTTCFINNLSMKSKYLTNNYIKTNFEFSLCSSAYKNIEAFENSLKEFIITTDKISNTKSELHIAGSPYKELITNKILSRLFSHNLKEIGIINIQEAKNLNSGISFGSVSHIAPCIHSYVNVVCDDNIEYGTKAFAAATVLPFADDIIFKTACALAITAVDLIEKPNLISEMKTELYNLLHKN